MRKLLKFIVIIPNLPFIVILGICIYSKIMQNTGIIEMEFLGDDDLQTKEIKQYVLEVYPKHLRYVIAFVGYFLLWYFMF